MSTNFVLRNICIIITAYCGGLRMEEVGNLNVHNFQRTLDGWQVSGTWSKLRAQDVQFDFPIPEAVCMLHSNLKNQLINLITDPRTDT